MSGRNAGVVEPQQRNFVSRHLFKKKGRPKLAGVVQNMEQQIAYEKAVAKLQPGFAAAKKVLDAPNPGKAVEDARQGYTDATTSFDNVSKLIVLNDYVGALGLLQVKENAAKAILVAKAQADGAALKQKQFDSQAAAYKEMSPVLTDVKRSYLPDGAAKRIGEEKLSADNHFKDYLAALGSLEDAKRGVDPAVPVAPDLAKTIKANCEAVVIAAQTYLTHYDNDLNDFQKNSKDSKSKKRYCEESLVSARHYGMAMDLDAAGEPTQAQPWNRETETRVAGLQAAMHFESGYQKATGLNAEGAGGASDSYWIKSAAVQEGTDDAGKPTGVMVANKRGEAIFKPADGEEFPEGSSDQKGAGAAKEALASANAKLFGAMTGIDLGVPDTNVVSIAAYAIKGAIPNSPPQIGSAQQHAGVSKQINDITDATRKQIKPAEAHKMALMDILSLSVDRHGGNIMVDDSDPTNPKLIPIDHGGTLPSRNDFPKVKERMGGITCKQASGAKTINILLDIPASYENFDPEMQAGIELLDPAAMEQGMKDQRAALDVVHPDLGAAGKVGDDSFHMSKRAMMFLKRAAKTLSPAEIQIALAAYGEALFDATDANFDAVADQVIVDAAPKKPAYLEFLTTPRDQQTIILGWLTTNGWTLFDETGNSNAEAFMMRDPVNALKLFKSDTMNNNVVPLISTNIKVPNADPNALVDDATKTAILNAFTELRADVSDNSWKQRLATWTQFNQMGGLTVYNEVLRETKSEHGSLSEAYKSLTIWRDINQPQNVALKAQLLPITVFGPNTLNTLEPVRRALMAPAIQKIVARQLKQASDAGAAIDDVKAVRNSATKLLTAIRQIIESIEDQTQARPFGQQADAAAAKLRQGDSDGAEVDAQALMIEVSEFARNEAKQSALALADGLASLQLLEDELSSLAKLRVDLKEVTSLKLMRELLGEFNNLDKKIKSRPAQPKPGPAIARPQAAAPQPAAKAPFLLPAFSWDAADASEVKKQAVKAKMFKDTKTGLSAAMAKVKKVQDRIDLIETNWQPSTTKPMFELALKTYGEFRMFVASKLRGVSKDIQWQSYCNSANNKVTEAIGDIQKRLDALSGGGA